MSSFSTFSPSLEQTYCCFSREPSFLCSQLNEIAADDSPAENILIGTETSPKEIVAEPMECAGISPTIEGRESLSSAWPGSSWVVSPPHHEHDRQRRRVAHLRPRHAACDAAPLLLLRRRLSRPREHRLREAADADRSQVQRDGVRPGGRHLFHRLLHLRGAEQHHPPPGRGAAVDRACDAHMGGHLRGEGVRG